MVINSLLAGASKTTDTSGALIKVIHDFDVGLDDGTDDTLGDSIAHFNLDNLIPNGLDCRILDKAVESDHAHFSSVICVDSTRGVRNSKVGFQAHPRAWTDLDFIPWPDVEGQAGAYQFCFTRLNGDIFQGVQIEATRARSFISRDNCVFMESLDLKLHEDAVPNRGHSHA